MSEKKPPQDISIDKIIEDANAEKDKLIDLNLKRRSPKLQALLEQAKVDADDPRSILEQIRARQAAYNDTIKVHVPRQYNAHCLFQEITEKLNQDQDIDSLKDIIVGYLDAICAELPDATARRIRRKLG